MSENNEVHRQFLTGERALFGASGLRIYDTIFDDGESPLKESRDIELYNCMFRWKYPLWYGKNILVENCTVFENGRAGMWYTDDLTFRNTIIEAPKSFRHCDRLTLDGVDMPNAAETLWNCRNVTMKNVTAHGDYLAMNVDGAEIDGLRLVGNYCFDGAKNITIRNSRLLSKDSFWNAENVTVYDSFISGEYLAWNAHDITFVNCTIESLQGLCYIDGLTMKNCKLINTTLSFEYSTADADIIGHIDSVKNPSGGRIRCESIGELIMEPDKVDISKTVIECYGEETANV